MPLNDWNEIREKKNFIYFFLFFFFLLLLREFFFLISDIVFDEIILFDPWLISTMESD